MARIDPEEFFDFTACGPTVELTESAAAQDRVARTPARPRQRCPGAEGDLVMLRGVEPSLRWRRYCDAVIEVARATGARMVITLGALLADVPHSRPVSLTGLASDQGLVDRARLRAHQLRGPHRA